MKKLLILFAWVALATASVQAQILSIIDLSGTNPPVIYTQPSDQTAPVGATAQFTVLAVQSPTLTYQWYFNGSNAIAGATSSTLTISNVQPSDAGIYSVTLANDYGSTNSLPAMLTVTAAVTNNSPVITSQPAGQTVPPGSSASFSVGATGPSLAYQWYFDGTNVAGATSSTLTISNAQPSDAGDYFALITNPYGSTNSAAAVLTVTTSNLAPVITSQPINRAVMAGISAQFSVGATGPSLAYQWYFDGTNVIPGGTSPTLTISNAQPSDDGIYSVLITNPYGSTNSAYAELTVITVTSNLPPLITSQPTNQTVPAGAFALFTVGATGPSLAYQWYFDGTNAIPGGTSPTLTISNAQPSDDGIYSVLITNPYGSTNSAYAELTVTTVSSNLPPYITSQPISRAVMAGISAQFSVSATGPSLAYQWYFDGTNAIPWATSSTLTISNAQPSDDGIYSVLITNPYGSTNSSYAELTVITVSSNLPPLITSQPTNQTVPAGAFALFTVGATGPSLAYQWFFNGSNIITGATSPILSISNAQTSAAGFYSVLITNAYGATNSSAAMLTVTSPTTNLPPVITSQPASQTVQTGNFAWFTVGATGPSLAYQWFFDGSNAIAGATSSTLTISNAQASNAGYYSVLITNSYGVTNSMAATLTVTIATNNNNPIIIKQPTSQTVLTGNLASFSVVATGPSLVYQWFFDGSNAIAGATSSTLSISNAQTSNSGHYSVDITNAYGATNSFAVLLTVTPATNTTAPFITSQPLSQSVQVGSTAHFTVGATGSSLAYQWFFNGSNAIAGASGSTLSISNAQASNAGYYSVLITNRYGATNSLAALLTVTPVTNNNPTLIIVQPTNETVRVGTPARFTAVVTGAAVLKYQWFFNGSNAVAGATYPTLIITNAQFSNAGAYSLQITNAYGTTNSCSALLTVTPPDPMVLNTPNLGHSLQLYWPTNAGAFGVQSATSPAGPWSNLTGLNITYSGTNAVVTVSNAQQGEFFRLVAQ